MGFEPLRAEPNGFRVHLLSRSDTLSWHGTEEFGSDGEATTCEVMGAIMVPALATQVHVYDVFGSTESLHTVSIVAIHVDSEGIRTPAGRAQWISSP